MLKLNDTGPDVGRAQQLLIEVGLGIDQADLAAATFGPSTFAAVRQFQATHIGPDGHALAEDGVIGDNSFWALSHPSSSQRGSLFTAPGWRCAPSDARPELVPVLQWAVGHIGVVEIPSNRGPEIDQWAQSAGVDLGSPWCALAVSAAYQQMPTGSPLGWLASAFRIKLWGLAHDRVVPAGAPLLHGDIWILLRADFHGHTGLVAGPADDVFPGHETFPGHEHPICTLEGNASNAYRGLIRDPATFDCVVRPVPL